MRPFAWLAPCALLACKGEPTVSPPPPPPPVRATDAMPIDAAPASTAPPPGELAVCGTPPDQEPLAALCALGQPAAKAAYDCAEPRPIMFCRGAIEWTCFRNVPGGEEVPGVQLSAFHASDAPQPKSGEVIDTASMKRDGDVVGVQIKWTEASDARGAAKVRALVDQLVGWGCVVTHQYRGTVDLGCGGWTAEVSYNDIIDRVFLEATLPGRFTCR